MGNSPSAKVVDCADDESLSEKMTGFAACCSHDKVYRLDRYRRGCRRCFEQAQNCGELSRLATVSKSEIAQLLTAPLWSEWARTKGTEERCSNEYVCRRFEAGVRVLCDQQAILLALASCTSKLSSRTSCLGHLLLPKIQPSHKEPQIKGGKRGRLLEAVGIQNKLIATMMTS